MFNKENLNEKKQNNFLYVEGQQKKIITIKKRGFTFGPTGSNVNVWQQKNLQFGKTKGSCLANELALTLD